MDCVAGLVLYAVTAVAFGRPFSLVDLVIAIFFAVAPDFDFIPFVILRKRLRLVSHWLIHFPLLYIPVGAAIVVLLGGGAFHLALFISLSFVHFLHDAASVPGIQWFWPISKMAYAVHKFRFVRVDPQKRRRFYERVAEDAPHRSIIEEIRFRVGKGRPKWFSRH